MAVLIGLSLLPPLLQRGDYDWLRLYFDEVVWREAERVRGRVDEVARAGSTPVHEVNGDLSPKDVQAQAPNQTTPPRTRTRTHTACPLEVVTRDSQTLLIRWLPTASSLISWRPCPCVMQNNVAEGWRGGCTCSPDARYNTVF